MSAALRSTGPEMRCAADATTASGRGAPALVVDDAFVHAHQAFVRRTAYRMGVRHVDVDDAVQETMLAAVRRAHSFERGREPRAWLFGITRNVARKMLRHPREVAMAEPPDHATEALQEEQLRARRRRSLLHRALAELSEEQRDVVVLHALEGWPMKRVADAVGCKVPTAYSRYRLGHARVGRIVRGQQLRARFAAAAAALLGLFGGHTTAAAASAGALLLIAGATLLHASVAPPAAPALEASDAPITRHGPARAAAPSPAATAPAPPEEPAAQEAHPQPPPLAEPAERRRGRLAAPSTAPVENSAAVDAADSGEVGSRQGHAPGEAAPVEAQATPDSASAPTIPSELGIPPVTAASEPLSELSAPTPRAELDALIAEGRLLRQARQLASRDPEAARAILSRYRQRFPAGRLRHEATQLERMLR